MPTDTDQQQFAEQLAQQLRGLQLPEPVSWWPLAIGWWIVIAISLLVCSIVVFRLVKKYRQNRYRKLALGELQNSYSNWQQHQDPHQYLHSSNAILKRVIREIEPNTNTPSTSKSGEDWSILLQQYATTPISKNTLNALSIECYTAKPDVDINHVHQQIKTWLSKHRRLTYA